MARCVFQIIWIVIIHLWLSPLSTGNEGDLDCIPSIVVPRNTVWKVCGKEPLRINCTIESESHCWNILKVTWCKIQDTNNCKLLNHSKHATTEWRNITESRRMLFLIFQNVSKEDAGLYRCEIISPTPSVSHAINVTVTDYDQGCSAAAGAVSQENNTTTSNSSVTKAENSPVLSYVYVCSGVVGLIFIVVVSVIVTRCRGQKTFIKETIHENQSTATPVADLTPPIYPREPPRKFQTLPAQVNPSPSYTYDTPPVRVTSLRDHLSTRRHPVHRELPRRCHDRGNVEEVEEENPLIYATLNHEAAPQRPVRVAHVQIEASEYAAIKVT